MIEITINTDIARDGLAACEALTALLTDLLCDRRTAEFGERGLLGLYLVMEAQESALRKLGDCITEKI